MKRIRILILGAGFMQGVAIRTAKEKGWYVIAVDGNRSAPCAGEADRFEPIDLKDREGLVAFATSLKADGGLDGVFTAATDFSASVAAVAEACGLPGHRLEAALDASDKLRMRSRFEAAAVPSPKYIGIRSENLITAEASIQNAGIGYPLVVKPADNMGARGCRSVAEPQKLVPALLDAIHYSRTGTAIVEQFMEGPEFSIEALVYDGEVHLTGLADRHIFFPPYFIEMGHTIPSEFEGTYAAPIIDVFRRGIAALGLTHGAAKGDIKLTPQGAMVGEIAGRLSGGYMSGWTFPYSSGIDLTGSALDLAVGDTPSPPVPKHRYIAAERAWISIPGIVDRVYGIDAARALPAVRDVFPRAAAGDRITFPRNNVEKCGNVLAVAMDRRAAIADAEAACASIVLRLRPNDSETEAFIESAGKDPSGYPPAAFCIVEEFQEAAYRDFRLETGTVMKIPESIHARIDSIHDWQGRTPRKALEKALSIEPGLALKLAEGNRNKYWKAFVTAGIQGLLYVHDSER